MDSIRCRKMAGFLLLSLLIGWIFFSQTSVAAQGPAARPPTCGHLISDTCILIEEHHASLQWLGALSFYPGAFTPNWRAVSTKGNFYTFNMPVKFTYGRNKDLETYYCSFLS